MFASVLPRSAEKPNEMGFMRTLDISLAFGVLTQFMRMYVTGHLKRQGDADDDSDCNPATAIFRPLYATNIEACLNSNILP